MKITKRDILTDLQALADTGICDTTTTIAAVINGDFDDVIASFEAISVTDATDLIRDLENMTP